MMIIFWWHTHKSKVQIKNFKVECGGWKINEKKITKYFLEIQNNEEERTEMDLMKIFMKQTPMEVNMWCDSSKE